MGQIETPPSFCCPPGHIATMQKFQIIEETVHRHELTLRVRQPGAPAA
jgi:hypothetical protein